MFFKLVSLSLLLIFTNNVFAKPLKDVSLIGKTKLLSERSPSKRSQQYSCDDEYLKWYVPGEIIVKFKTNPDSNEFKSKNLLRNSTENISYKKVFDADNTTTGKSRLKKNSFNFDKVYLLTIDDINHKYLKQEPFLKDDCERTFALIKELNADPNIEYAEPNVIHKLFKVLNDPLLNLGTVSSIGVDPAWGIFKIGANRAWDLSTGKGVRVAVIDSGVDWTHPDLSKNIPILGGDYVDNDPYPEDLTGHGTHVAGTIGAIGNNNRGIAGIAYEAEILPYKVLNTSGSGSTSAIAIAILKAVDDKANIINLSLGSPLFTQFELEACNYALDNNVLVIGASGNEGEDGVRYPAGYSSVVSVGASTTDDQVATFSNYGNWVHLAAPGEKIISTFSYNTCDDDCSNQIVLLDDSTYGYSLSDGTSMAAPHVSGLSALIKSYWQEFTPNDILALMSLTADPLVSGNSIAGGRINAADALAAAQYIKSLWAVDDDRNNQLTNSEIANYIWRLRKSAKFFNENHDVNNDGIVTYQDDEVIFDLVIKPQGQAWIDLYNSYYAVMSVVDKEIDGILVGKERKSYKKTMKKLIRNNKYNSRYDVNFDSVVNSADVQLISIVFSYVGISI